jgi:hypothetical protein
VSRFGGGPVRRNSDGSYSIRLDPTVRNLLASVSEQVVPVMESDDPATRRLFPPAYVGGDPDSARAERGYRDLVDGAMRNHHRTALDTLASTATATTLSAEELALWLSAIETLRLIVGTRLDVTEDMVPPTADDPSAPEYALYDLLGMVQAAIIDALAAELPEEGRPEGPEGLL